jgi:hypothetical protein
MFRLYERMVRAGPASSWLEIGTCPLRQLWELAKTINSVAAVQAACHASPLGSCDCRHTFKT